jgi:23S rRNA (adenine1618-N6)-methyltransferase
MNKNTPPIKQNLHPRNEHKSGYDIDFLIAKHPLLNNYLIKNDYNNQSIDYSNYDAVIALNCALLKAYYRIDHWQIPEGYLCPPIPGRVDYIHYLADLLQSELKLSQPSSPRNRLNHSDIHVIDIGTGASCIYPILGQRCYQWHFSASDIDPVSVACAKELVIFNKGLSKKITVNLQKNQNSFFDGVIKHNQMFDLTLCNPPFHSSLEEALTGNSKKRNNLNKVAKKVTTTQSSSVLNFGGQKAELHCQGGELVFIKAMMQESRIYKDQVLFFSSLVSKSAHLKLLEAHLKELKVTYSKVVKMSQGQKISHFIAWSFLPETKRVAWLQMKSLK